jgi:hypothetical protein
MFDSRTLQSMYQQWCNGNEEALHCWYEFVEFAAKHNKVSADTMMRELQKYYWFKWGEQ